MSEYKQSTQKVKKVLVPDAAGEDEPQMKRRALDECYDVLAMSDLFKSMNYNISVARENGAWAIRILQDTADNITSSVSAITQNAADSIENTFVSFYEEKYKAGDLSFLVDGEEGITDTPPELLPYIVEEITKYKQEHGIEELELKTLLFDRDPATDEIILDVIIQRARDQREEELRKKGIVSHRAEEIEYPVDKLNNEIWRLLEHETNGQLTFKAEKQGTKKPLDIIYAIDFDALTDNTGIVINKRLTAFDKRVYIAISALYNAGNNVISLTQIYYAMGNTSRPSKTSLEKIYDSISKMTAAKIYVNNESEAGSYKYPKFVYDGSLLPLERNAEVINGKLTEAAIHIFREPPMVSFAKQREQITTVSVKLLQSPVSKTEGNLGIDDYLIERIARAKKSKKSERILYNTICEKANITGERQKRRVPQKVSEYLDHYKVCNMIESYRPDKDGVTVKFADKKA